MSVFFHGFIPKTATYGISLVAACMAMFFLYASSPSTEHAELSFFLSKNVINVFFESTIYILFPWIAIVSEGSKKLRNALATALPLLTVNYTSRYFIGCVKCTLFSIICGWWVSI